MGILGGDAILMLAISIIKCQTPSYLTDRLLWSWTWHLHIDLQALKWHRLLKSLFIPFSHKKIPIEKNSLTPKICYHP